MAAAFTSRFCSATRCSRPVSTGSPNSVHQFGSTGSATGMLGGRLTASFGPANQEAGDAQSGRLKSGPTVQPADRVTAATSTSLRVAFSIIKLSKKPQGSAASERIVQDRNVAQL